MKISYLRKSIAPDSPGIYIFRDKNKRPLYIGRATSLKNRVKSYFDADLILTRGVRIKDMVDIAAKLDWQKTDSVLEAIILESALIKKYQPPYNVDEKDDKSNNYVVITDEELPRVFLERARNIQKNERGDVLDYKIKYIFGPFPEGGLIKSAMRIVRRMFPYRDKKSNDKKHESFYQSIGRSPDFPNNESIKHYQKTISYLVLFFSGKKKELRKLIEKDMKSYAKAMKFEQAGEAAHMLRAIDHINDVSLIKDEVLYEQNGFRMEAYDIAHMSGKDVVGVMVVSSNGQLSKNEYRKFKIKVDANNDTGNLAEVLKRRLNHTEWNYPDLIVVDGSEIQRKVAEDVLQARRINIPVVAVTKDESHKARALIGNPQIINERKKEIVGLNAEAHRFAISYHRLKRDKSFLN